VRRARAWTVLPAARSRSQPTWPALKSCVEAGVGLLHAMDCANGDGMTAIPSRLALMARTSSSFPQSGETQALAPALRHRRNSSSSAES